MSEQKSLTLDEAKGRMEHIRRVSIEYNDLPRINCATDCIDLLARVEQPSEDDMAVLWLMREKGWMIAMESSGLVKGYWYKYFFSHEHGQMIGLPFNPTEEARKLGWKP